MKTLNDLLGDEGEATVLRQRCEELAQDKADLLRQNAALRLEIEKEVQRTADAYSAQLHLQKKVRDMGAEIETLKAGMESLRSERDMAHAALPEWFDPAEIARLRALDSSLWKQQFKVAHYPIRRPALSRALGTQMSVPKQTTYNRRVRRATGFACFGRWASSYCACGQLKAPTTSWPRVDSFCEQHELALDPSFRRRLRNARKSFPILYRRACRLLGLPEPHHLPVELHWVNRRAKTR